MEMNKTISYYIHYFLQLTVPFQCFAQFLTVPFRSHLLSLMFVCHADV